MELPSFNLPFTAKINYLEEKLKNEKIVKVFIFCKPNI